jgi:methylated-DNA-[protein]-cysteine S-methyltransferase
MDDLENRLSSASARYDVSSGQAPVLPDGDVSYVVHETPIGTMVLATAASRVVASSFADEETVTARLAKAISPRVLRQSAPLDDLRRQLDDYLAGRRREFDLDVELTLATQFQRLVLGELPRSARYGTTTTYGALASEVERPRAARAVGTALGANPVCVVLPCHRVIAANGALTGYAGGPDAKRYLLDLERPAQ